MLVKFFAIASSDAMRASRSVHFDRQNAMSVFRRLFSLASFSIPARSSPREANFRSFAFVMARICCISVLIVCFTSFVSECASLNAFSFSIVFSCMSLITLSKSALAAYSVRSDNTEISSSEGKAILKLGSKGASCSFSSIALKRRKIFEKFARRTEKKEPLWEKLRIGSKILKFWKNVKMSKICSESRKSEKKRKNVSLVLVTEIKRNRAEKKLQKVIKITLQF